MNSATEHDCAAHRRVSNSLYLEKILNKYMDDALIQFRESYSHKNLIQSSRLKVAVCSQDQFVI